MQLDIRSLINPDGSLNPSGTIGLAFNQVTVRTAVTPDLVFPISANGAPPSAAMQEFLDQLRPTVEISGPAGTYTLAPYGTSPGQTSWLPLALGVGGAVLFLGWAVFGR